MTMTRRMWGALSFAILVAGAVGGQPRTPATSGSESRAADFLTRLQRAVDSDDRRSVSTLVAYPTTVLAGGFNIPVKDPSSFIRMYDVAITPEVRCAIAASELPQPGQPKPSHPVIISSDGLTIANGAVWAPLKNGRFRIARIVVPRAVPSVDGRKGVERVSFEEPKGERLASYAGWLVRHNEDTFVVRVRKGETLNVRIEGFRGRDATLRIAKTTATPSVPLGNLGRTWSATADAESDYRIQVVHLAPFCDPPQRYRLFIAVR